MSDWNLCFFKKFVHFIPIVQLFGTKLFIILSLTSVDLWQCLLFHSLSWKFVFFPLSLLCRSCWSFINLLLFEKNQFLPYWLYAYFLMFTVYLFSISSFHHYFSYSPPFAFCYFSIFIGQMLRSFILPAFLLFHMCI